MTRDLTIVTYNVHRCVGCDRRLDLHRTAEVIAACKPDIVALQELDVSRQRTGGVDQAHALATLLDMRWHFHPAFTVEEEQYGNAILTHLPERLVKTGALPRCGVSEPRGALWVAVTVGDTELQIINTHLGLMPYERLLQARRLMSEEWLGHEECRDPAILVGDFNSVRLSRTYRVFASRLRDGQLLAKGRPKRTFPAQMPLFRIDHVFCSRSVEVIETATVSSAAARRASDHLPLVINFRLLKTAARDSLKERRRQGFQASWAPMGSPR